MGRKLHSEAISFGLRVAPAAVRVEVRVHQDRPGLQVACREVAEHLEANQRLHRLYSNRTQRGRKVLDLEVLCSSSNSVVDDHSLL